MATTNHRSVVLLLSYCKFKCLISVLAANIHIFSSLFVCGGDWWCCCVSFWKYGWSGIWSKCHCGVCDAVLDYTFDLWIWCCFCKRKPQFERQKVKAVKKLRFDHCLFVFWKTSVGRQQLKLFSELVCHFNGLDHHHHDASFKTLWFEVTGMKWNEPALLQSLPPSVTLFLSQRLNLFKSLRCIMFPIERAGFNWWCLFKGWEIDFQAWSSTSLM